MKNVWCTIWNTLNFTGTLNSFPNHQPYRNLIRLLNVHQPQFYLLKTGKKKYRKHQSLLSWVKSYMRYHLMLSQSRKTFWKLVISLFEYTSLTGCFLLVGTASSILTVLLAIKDLYWFKICFSNFWPICSILPNRPAVRSFFPAADFPVFVDSYQQHSKFFAG